VEANGRGRERSREGVHQRQRKPADTSKVPPIHELTLPTPYYPMPLGARTRSPHTHPEPDIGVALAGSPVCGGEVVSLEHVAVEDADRVRECDLVVVGRLLDVNLVRSDQRFIQGLTNHRIEPVAQRRNRRDL
jgi:hypothetical protein